MAPPKNSKPQHSQQSSLLSFFKKPPTTAVPALISSDKEQKNASPAKTEITSNSTAQKAKAKQQITEETTEKLAIKSENTLGQKQKQSSADSMEVDSDEDSDAPLVKKISDRNRKRVSYREPDSEPEEAELSSITEKKRRLRRRISDSDDSGDEFIPPKTTNDDDNGDFGDDIDEDELMQEVDSIVSARADDAKGKALPVTPLTEKFKRVSVTTKPSASIFNQKMKEAAVETSNAFSRMTGNSTSKEEDQKDRNQKFKEKNSDRYHWLANPKDLQGNPEDSPEYDPRTLYIPKSEWSKFTPFERQYWEVKHKHWDSIVFFKKGKFYELYERDADIGHKDFDLKMTDRVNMRMVGVPEMSFDYWTAQFIAKGHKVARVDQMETAIGKSMREKDVKPSKEDKIIRRELTSILTAGTLVDSGLLTNELSTYCMSIKEECADETIPPKFGICFVDTSTAQFNLVHFDDDIHRTKFETLIMQIKPRELVLEKGRLSKATVRMLKSVLDNDPLWNHLIPENEFWASSTTEDELNFADYFGSEGELSSAQLSNALAEARKDPLLMSAFGGLIWYLRSLKLDRELLSAKNVLMYDPIRNATSLVLDGQTLANLEVFQNSHDGSTEGTVFKLLANSITPFGKRLFKQWLCHPLRRIEDINARLDAVEVLMRYSDVLGGIIKSLTGLPDLERLISRIHSGKIRVKEFLVALEGFRKMSDIMAELTDYKDKLDEAKLLNQLVDQFPSVSEKLSKIEMSFITAEVNVDYQKMSTMIPNSGTNAEWDKLARSIEDVEDEFEQHLSIVKKQLKTSQVTYKDVGKDIYQIEVAKGVKTPNDWVKMSATSKFNRFYDQTVRTLVQKYKELLETKNAFVKRFSLEVYANFDQYYPMWLTAVQSIAQLDALMGLAKGSMNMGEPACRPTLLDQEDSVIEFEELRHPCVIPGVATDFIPNNVHLGGGNAGTIVLTGPNMGGKSTLLRQTCVAIILAQLGGYVPAKSCSLTPCDRIYTRIGANDNIMGGQSTFMVELAETSKILREATPRSMVILDELGRGTSTFDGYAIAYSVLHYLSTHIGCLGMFATHYQTLCKEFDRSPEINNMHMGYMMDEDGHNVTFLYKLTAGICEKSFGMNVATMAGIPKSVVDRALVVAKDVEVTHRAKDSTYAMDVDGGKKNFKVTPAMAADLAYLINKNSSAVDNKLAKRRILESFKNSM